MIDFKRTVLPNGLRLVTVRQKDALATTVMVIVEAGSKYETKNLNGISHFLEHMCFKGTKKRPRQIDIARELEGLGAEYNAFTGSEFTAYYAKVKNESFEKALDVVADMYLGPVFNPKEIEKERGVIIEEINMYEDLPHRKVQEVFMKLVYGDQPAGWSIAGRKEVIQTLARKDFLRYRGKHYLPQATTVVVAGGFDTHEKLARKVGGYFNRLRRSKKHPKPKVKEAQRNPKELVFHKESDQTHLVLGFRAFSIFDKRRFALEILADILGGGISSRLFQKVRSELSAAYYVRASTDLYSDHGLVTMAAGVSHGKLEKVIKASLSEFAKLRDKKVSAGELKRAKEHVTGRLLLSVETSDELALFYGGQEAMRQEIKSPLELVESFRKVRAEEIQEVARDVFRNERLNLAAVGPLKDESFEDILLLT